MSSINPTIFYTCFAIYILRNYFPFLSDGKSQRLKLNISACMYTNERKRRARQRSISCVLSIALITHGTVRLENRVDPPRAQNCTGSMRV